jgi:hypothetical protein
MNFGHDAQSRRRRLALALWALLFLFILRVSGQLLVALGWGWFLPPMAEWYSGLLSYRWLLPSQLIIIALYGKVCLDFTRGAGFFMKARRRVSVWLLGFGALYFASMVVRYILTMWLYPQRRWTGGCIPIVFHLVLAAFILLVGRDYYVRSRERDALRNSTKDERVRCRPMSINSLTTGGWRAQSGKSRT